MYWDKLFSCTCIVFAETETTIAEKTMISSVDASKNGRDKLAVNETNVQENT